MTKHETLMHKLEIFLREEHRNRFEMTISDNSPARTQRLIELRDAKAAYDRSTGKPNKSDGPSRTAIEPHKLPKRTKSRRASA